MSAFHQRGSWFYCAIVVLCLSATCHRSLAQRACEGIDVNYGVMGMNGTPIAAVEWDPDASGPRTPVILFAGAMSWADNVPVGTVAQYDPTTATWSRLQSQIGLGITCMVVRSDNSLAVGGRFLMSGYSSDEGVAIMEASGWRGLGRVAGGRVEALLALPDGRLVAAGSFTSIGGVAANSVAMWDGNGWAPIGSGLDNRVQALALLPNGDIVAGGNMLQDTIGLPRRIKRWNGVSWSVLGGGVDGEVFGLTTLANGDLIAAGRFGNAGGVATNGTARWNGTSWAAMSFGTDPSIQVRAVRQRPNGEIYAVGNFSAIRTSACNVSRWDGQRWGPIASSLNSCVQGTVNAIAFGGSEDVYLAGRFSLPGIPMTAAAKWDGTRWSVVGKGFNGPVRKVAESASGAIVVSGNFSYTPGGLAPGIALLQDGVWRAIGASIYSGANSLAFLPNGNILAGAPAGFGLQAVGGSGSLVLWDGNRWNRLHPVGSAINKIVVRADNEVFLFGDIAFDPPIGRTGVAKWNGVEVIPPNEATRLNGTLKDAAVRENGNVVAVGNLILPGNSAFVDVAELTPTGWQVIGNDFSSDVTRVVVMGEHKLVVAGKGSRMMGTMSPNVAAWDENGWSPVGKGLALASQCNCYPITDLAVTRTGEVLATGIFTRSAEVPISNVARFNGREWKSVGIACSGDDLSLTPLHDGSVMITGLSCRSSGLNVAYNLTHLRLARCRADYNCSDSVTVQDVLDYVGEWLSTGIADQSLRSIDFNEDGVIDFGDLLGFLDTWFLGCGD